MSTGLFHLVYCSRNTLSAEQGETTEEIAKILAVSRTNNAYDGVTGAMLYSDGCFAQVLEGDFKAVHRTFERIQCDERHRGVTVLEACRVGSRMFGMWDMAMAEPTDPAKAKTILGQALAIPNGGAGTTVLALLGDLVNQQVDWTGVP